MIQPRDDCQFIDEPRGPAWPKVCAYCGALIASPAERMHHATWNFSQPGCQLQPAVTLHREVKVTDESC